jgi:hypothetical protein
LLFQNLNLIQISFGFAVFALGAQNETILFETMPKKERDILAQREREIASYESALMQGGNS